MQFVTGSGPVLLLVCLAISAAVSAEPPTWDLEQALERGLRVAPAMRSATLSIEARRGAANQAGRWPNPRIELEAGDALGRKDGRDDVTITDIALTQKLPLWGTTSHERNAARARLEQAESERQASALALEQHIAAAFHDWQHARAGLELASERLEEAQKLSRIAQRRNELGELSEREQLRTELFHSRAQRLLARREGTLEEAEATLSALLDTPPQHLGTAPALEAPPPPSDQGPAKPRHPELDAAASRERAAQAEADHAAASALPEIGVTLFTEKTLVADERENSYGIGLELELPLWNRNQGNLQQARAQQGQRASERDALRIDLERQARNSRTHLSHLLSELERHRADTLAPAHRVLRLSQHGYENGEVTLPELLDAIRTHFEARNAEQQLLAEAWRAWREHQSAQGRSMKENHHE